MARHDPEVDAVRQARREGQENERVTQFPSPELRAAVAQAKQQMEKRNKQDG